MAEKRPMTEKQMKFISSLNERYKRTFRQEEDVDFYNVTMEKKDKMTTRMASKVIEFMLGLFDTRCDMCDVYHYEDYLAKLQAL